MKNNNNTVSLSTMPRINDLNANFQAVQEVKKQYEQVRKDFCDQLYEAIKDLPQDAPVLNRDLAQAAGLTPLHMASIINHGRCDIRSTSVTVTRRFIEVDEDGKPIEGATIKEQTSTLTGYYGKRDPQRRW